MTETAYQILFRGFDCLVAPTEEGHFDVSLFEEGAHVYTTDIPIDLSQFETDEEIDDNSSALIDEAAQAAVDEFEASRGSLGQGAGVGKMATKKTAYWSSMDYADWYCTLKATAFKDQAESLLEQYFAASRDQSCGNQDQAQARRMAEEKLANLEYELNMLNLSRMKCAKPNETIIVIKAYRSDKEACGTLLEEFLDGFRGTKFEDQALAKMKEYLDVKKQLEALYTDSTNTWRALDDIRQAMDELYVTALQQEVSDSVIDDSGIGIDSNMAADVMSLMEGVTLDPMFEEQSEMPPALFANKRAQEGEGGSSIADVKLSKSQAEALLALTGDFHGGKWSTLHALKQFGLVEEIDDKLVVTSKGEAWVEKHKGDATNQGKEVVASKFAQDSAYMDEPDRPMDDVLQDALAMVKSMRKSDPATIKNTIKAVYGLSDKDASDLVSYGKRAQESLKSGDRVNHPRFGDGTVVDVDSSSYSIPMASIDFDKFEGNKEDRIARPSNELTKIGKRAEKEKEENDGEYEVVELGQIHEGIDPAEVPLKDFPFAIGDKVTLSKAFEMPIWGGGTTELPKGTKGFIKNLYDGHGDAFMVTCEEGSTYCIPTEYLK
jgi:hypothetical protein